MKVWCHTVETKEILGEERQLEQETDLYRFITSIKIQEAVILKRRNLSMKKLKKNLAFP
jgi:hypothetical protein